MTTALVPVKSLARGKSRLRDFLPAELIEELSLAMLGAVLTALRHTPEIGEIAVVTPDATVAQAANAKGARVLLREDPGLNPSIQNAALELASSGMKDLMVVMGDLPGVHPTPLSSLLSHGRQLGERAVVISISKDGGTTALLRKPWNVIPTAYGPQSASRHYDLAKNAGVPVERISPEQLSIDIDQPEDLESFLASHTTPAGGPFLEQLRNWIAAQKDKNA